MPKVDSALLAVLVLAFATSSVSPAHAVEHGGDLKVGRMLIMGGYFYMCEWNCIVTRLSSGEWTVIDERGGWVHKEPIEFIPDP
jgi:hypothetical protein